jgi:hypothetical protein
LLNLIDWNGCLLYKTWILVRNIKGSFACNLESEAIVENVGGSRFLECEGL